MGPIGAFFALSLFGFWDVVPSWVHGVGLLVTLGAVFFTLWRITRSLRWPDRTQALRFIETSSGIQNRALSTLEDEVADRHDLSLIHI